MQKTLFRYARTTYRYAKKIYGLRKIFRTKHQVFQDELKILKEKQIVLERIASIQTYSLWIDQAQIPEGPTISVVMATRNRAHLIPRAIQSVLAQSYSRWELFIVDDGGTDHTQEILKSFSDPRIVTSKIIHSGASVARNHALDHIKGDIIVYLDDDNMMQKNWLKAVAFTFQRFPNKNVLFGARLIDDWNKERNNNTPGFPHLQFEIFDRKRLLKVNFIDIGTIAHRSHIPNLKFNEKLKTMEDWDLLLQLTANEAPIELPIISIHYTTDCTNRLSHEFTYKNFKQIRNKYSDN